MQPLQCKLNPSRIAHAMMGSTTLFGIGVIFYLPLPEYMRVILLSWIMMQLWFVVRRTRNAVLGFTLQDDAQCQLYTSQGVIEARYLPKAAVCRYYVVLYCQPTLGDRRRIPVTIWCDAVDADMFRRITIFAQWSLVK